jgi:outer membrane protein assembly factor BamB
MLSPLAQPVVATVPTESILEQSPADQPGAVEPKTQARLFIGTLSGQLWALEAVTGQLAWTAEVDGPVMNSPAVLGRRVFVASASGTVHAFDAADGTQLWQRDLGAPLTCSPLPVGRRVFLAGRDGRVHALDITAGVELWTSPLDAPAAGSCAWADGTVYVATHAATAYAINERDGELIWRKAMRGQDPWYYPVIADEAVMFRTRSAVHGPGSDGMESVLTKLPETTDAWPPEDWLIEQAAIAAHHEQPDERSFFVFDRSKGEELFTPAITRVGGSDCPPWPVVATTGLVYAHRRVRSTRMKGAMNFGSRFPIDFDQLDIEAADRKPLAALPLNSKTASPVKFADMNQTHYATIGGNMAYFYNARAGTYAMDLLTGRAYGLVRAEPTAIPAPAGTRDLLGDDGLLPRPAPGAWTEPIATESAPASEPVAHDLASGVVIADGGLFISMPTTGCIVRIDGSRKQADAGSEPAFVAPMRDRLALAAGSDDLEAPDDATAREALAGNRPPLPETVSPAEAVRDVLAIGALPAKAEPLREKLVQQVRAVIEAEPLAPAYYLAGEKFPTYLFDSPADLTWALCEALPFLPDDLREPTLQYVRQHMQAHPLWKDKPLPTKAARYREFFPLTEANRLKVTAVSRLREAGLRRLYALWLYAHHADDADYIHSNWSAIHGFARKSLAEIRRHGPTYADLTGLIGLARLAILAEQSDVATEAIAAITDYAPKLSNVSEFRKTFKERSRAVLAPSFLRVKDCPPAMGMLLADLAPATIRVLDAKALAKHRDAVATALPTWYIGLGGLAYGEDVWADAVTMPPPIPAGYFQLHALLGQTPPDDLARRVDVPCVEVGDCYYIRKLSAVLRQHAASEYVSISPPEADPQ